MKEMAKDGKQNSIVWPELSNHEVEKIAMANNCSHMTIYRRYKSIKNGTPVLDDITVAISELVEIKRNSLRLNEQKIKKQLSHS